MFYEIHQLRENLLLVRWTPKATPNSQPEANYIADLRSRFDAATQLVYVLSDLRYGKITDVYTLRELGKLTYHPKFGGGAAWATDISTTFYVGVFSRFAAPSKREDGAHARLSDALADLERRQPGLTDGIDWDAISAYKPE